MSVMNPWIGYAILTAPTWAVLIWEVWRLINEKKQGME